MVAGLPLSDRYDGWQVGAWKQYMAGDAPGPGPLELRTESQAGDVLAIPVRVVPSPAAHAVLRDWKAG